MKKKIAEIPVTSPKIIKLERILDRLRNSIPIEEKIRQKEEFLQSMVDSYKFETKKRAKMQK